MGEGERVNLDTEILLCNSVAGVICVIFIGNLAKTSVKILGSTEMYHAAQRGIAVADDV